MILQKHYDSVSMQALTRGLDAAHLRQSAIADNLANVNTPFYKRKRVSFETELRRALEQQGQHKLKGFDTHPEHLPINRRTPWNELTPDVHREHFTTWRNDGNNVDIDLEMAEEAKNTLNYIAYSKLLQGRFTGLKDTIKAMGR